VCTFPLLRSWKAREVSCSSCRKPKDSRHKSRRVVSSAPLVGRRAPAWQNRAEPVAEPISKQRVVNQSFCKGSGLVNQMRYLRPMWGVVTHSTFAASDWRVKRGGSQYRKLSLGCAAYPPAMTLSSVSPLPEKVSGNG